MSDERYSYQQKFVKLSENWRKSKAGLVPHGFVVRMLFEVKETNGLI